MIYTIEFYQRGRLVNHLKSSAKSHREALKLSDAWTEYSHAVITGKTVKRFGKNTKEIKDLPRLWKAYSDLNPAILAMIGNVTEFYRFETVEERDRLYEEVTCTDSTSAGSAEADKEQNGITVSTEEISDSKSGLTLTKISNGYAKFATWRDMLTLSSIDKSSGVDSAEDTDFGTWSPGSMPFPSNRNLNSSSKMWKTAIVLRIPDNDHEVGTNEFMKRLVGTSIKVKKSGHYWKSMGWMWKEEWLDFVVSYEREEVKYVKPVEVGTILNGTKFVRGMTGKIGKAVNVKRAVNHSGHKCYDDGRWHYALEWLSDYPTDMSNKYTKTYKILPTTRNGQVYTEAMKRLVGEIVTKKHGFGQGTSVYVNENPFIWTMSSLWEVK